MLILVHSIGEMIKETYFNSKHIQYRGLLKGITAAFHMVSIVHQITYPLVTVQLPLQAPRALKCSR